MIKMIRLTIAGWLLLAIAVSLLLMFCGLGLIGCTPAHRTEEAERQRKESFVSRTYTISAGYAFTTYKHDNHLWVSHVEHFVHHPDCPCRKEIQ